MREAGVDVRVAGRGVDGDGVAPVGAGEGEGGGVGACGEVRTVGGRERERRRREVTGGWWR